jgi:ribose transport system substrate-binding protein
MTSAQDCVNTAKEIVEKYTSRQDKWTGPLTGPVALSNQKIIFLASDMKNSGVYGVAQGVLESTKTIGWKVRMLDGQGSISGRTAIFNQAVALRPDGIILVGFDAVEQRPGLEAASQMHIPIVSWHAASNPGPVKGTPVFANVTTDATIVATAAASWVIVQANGKAGVIIFTDSAFQVAVAKANIMANVINGCSGNRVLAIEDTPIADTSNRMGQLTTALLERYGSKWNYSLAINDIYFDFMSPTLTAAGIKDNQPPTAIAAGDGSESAYQRVRMQHHQAVTVAEPLNLQGWQLVDELNRALSGVPWSGYVTPLHVVTPINIEFDGGAKYLFDPDNGYREHYRAIWKKN